MPALAPADARRMATPGRMDRADMRPAYWIAYWHVAPGLVNESACGAGAGERSAQPRLPDSLLTALPAALARVGVHGLAVGTQGCLRLGAPVGGGIVRVVAGVV